MKDLFGQAILDYQTNNSPEDLYTETSISELDVMPINYLFRDYDEMPLLEQKALDLTKGKTLDVGCGAGSHSLYLQGKEVEVSAIDISPKAIEACRLRGLKNVNVQNFLELDETEKFDTILFLMNGTGIFQNLVLINVFLDKIKQLLTENGQVLIDGTDIIYMFDEDEDGGKWIPSNGNYYGELDFTVHYKGEQEETIQWLYLDFDTLKNACNYHQLKCVKVKTEEDSYLAKITLA
ncbi:class I SAM-dependent methyltransferase [Empedobacter brevis]|uniref:Class I SAM-dependent methyltransferase n=1 Tax=Empedobacter brevis TaxID=247 RepID=A0AAJ1QGT6_9FLAO|nr:class I SAM-dependent methyltransferase [Empedobacter brevis]MDM1073823.1 class I SAM-dependent methyltransferase [Empedobacter brevis]QHC84897.1 methyltransferase [Empedobacter brevis]